MTQYRTLDQMELEGKRVLLRAGFDVPIEGGVVIDTKRIEAILPTMRFILDHGASLILLAHQGRPKGTGYEKEFSQKPLIAVLESLLHTSVRFAPSCIGEETKKLAQHLLPGEVVLLENLRFDEREKKNDESFAKELSVFGDVYVNDAFPNCHREHASVVALAKMLPSCMGLHLHQEIKHLSQVNEDPRRPLVLIISGAKMETKVPVIERFLQIGDDILLGGGIANTFIAARGFHVGHSLYESDFLSKAQELMLEGEKEEKANIHVPRDVVIADSPDTEVILDLPLEDVEGDVGIYDIGHVTAERYGDMCRRAGMVIWNGPLGMYEREIFSGASQLLAHTLTSASREHGVQVIVGGGDTIDMHRRFACGMQSYAFVSTGGGAMLEFLAGKPFASLEALQV
ncbi:phosphoglycerate kinase [Candidatus Peribacteria bacterium RIFCSPHIGHO2_02_FULL_49_16]|nr:MAG: phosphoglycerate kinase [Candidatus Peribacteria bacterium RIFCSPHIGHO2_01_FULL_49_38]OGJ58930.1 MAG: phosphoglycerate kinase [Candidatus Peribacteria bacterium RIFCSPHIGHO2_02_FULL_49_16]